MKSDDKRTDRRQAQTLLAGYVGYDPRGLPERRYLGDGTEEEVEARAALARLIRANKLDDDLLEMLANVFDPDTSPHGTLGACERRVSLIYRRLGRREKADDPIQQTAIVEHVMDGVSRGLGVEEAVQRTAGRFSLSRDTVYRRWSSKKWARVRKLFSSRPTWTESEE